MATVQSEPVSPPDEPLYEVVDGERVELPPMGASEVSIIFRLAFLIELFVREHRLGAVFPEMLFRLDPDRTTNRRPDVAFVSAGTWPIGQKIPRGNAWHVVPDLAVEVVSPTDLAADLMAKVKEYFQAGVKRVWVIYPDLGRIQDFESPLASKWYGADDSVPGGELLPGFSFRLSEIL